MSKSILVIDMPEYCAECPCSDDCVEVCGAIDKPITEINGECEKPDWCPFQNIPNKKKVCGRYPQPDRIEPSWKIGYNACIDDILKGADDSDSNTINDGWIPCDKHLPLIPKEADSEEFIVMINGASEPTALMCDSDGTWFDDDGNIYDVIAWQMFPEPYIG